MKIKNRFSFVQFFGDGEVGEPDLEALQKEFEENWNPDDEEVKEPEIEEPTEETPSDSEIEDEPDDESETNEERSENEAQFPEQKQNEAFARMRRELEEKSKTASFLEKVAKQSGMSTEELIQAYERRQLEAEAEQKGVPVDVYERLQTLENENKQQRISSFARDYENQIKSTKEKYGLSEDDIRNTFSYLGKNGMINEDDTINLPFEDAYILANRDTILEKAKEEGRQSYLEEKKKKQEGNTVNTGGSVPSDSNTNSPSEQDIMDYFKKHDISI